MGKKEIEIEELKKTLAKLDKVTFFLEAAKTSEGCAIILADFIAQVNSWKTRLLKEDKPEVIYRLQGKLQVSAYLKSLGSIYESKRKVVVDRLKYLEGYPDA